MRERIEFQMTTSNQTPSIVSRLSALEAQSVDVKSLTERIEKLEAVVEALQQMIGTTDAPAPKVVGVVHSPDGRRHLSPEAKRHISEALKSKAAARKAAKLAAAETPVS